MIVQISLLNSPDDSIHLVIPWDKVCAGKKPTNLILKFTMTTEIRQNNDREVQKNSQALELALFISNLKDGVWILGIPSWLFGLTDRSFASLADGYVSPVEVLQLLTAFFFLVSWLYLKPEKSLDSTELATIQSYEPSLDYDQDEDYLWAAKAKMLELREQHMISQEYILPFSYLCQIYHLLNLKHLETVHNFSLNNLKVISVSQCQPTDIGGMLKFQTILDSPFNALRIWRQPIVEAVLILHTRHTVELRLPVYNNKYIVVIFSAIPINDTKHKFFIDIYSDLEWPRPLLQVLLHLAACLTLFEDLPYLQKLAERNLSRLVSLNKVSNHKTMWLFKRFVDLYGSSLEPAEPIKVIESQS